MFDVRKRINLCDLSVSAVKSVYRRGAEDAEGL